MEYTEEERRVAELQTDARMQLLSRRAQYYSMVSVDINREAIFQQILESNRKSRGNNRSKKLGETQNSFSFTEFCKQEDAKANEEMKRAVEKAKEEGERLKARGLLKESISLKIREIEQSLDVDQSKESSLDSYLENLLEMIHTTTIAIYESDIDPLDKDSFLQRIRRLDICKLESWMRNLQYNIVNDSAKIQRIREQLEQFSEMTGISLELNVEMHTEDDEAYCQQLVADELAERERQWSQSNVFSFVRNDYQRNDYQMHDNPRNSRQRNAHH